MNSLNRLDQARLDSIGGRSPDPDPNEPDSMTTLRISKRPRRPVPLLTPTLRVLASHVSRACSSSLAAWLFPLLVLGSTLIASGRSLDLLPNPPGRAFGDESRCISGDGSTAGGVASGIEYRAALWLPNGEILALGGGNVSGRVESISYDGQIAVGTIGLGNPTAIFRWTAANGGQFTSLGAPTGVDRPSGCILSRTGELMVGAGGRVWTWTEAAGFSVLDTPADANAWPTGLSSDGSAIVGVLWAPTAAQPASAWIWTAEHGVETLTPNLTVNWSGPFISDDGQIIVYSEKRLVAGTQVAQLVRLASGIAEPLPLPAGKKFCYPSAMSADGNTVVGIATEDHGLGRAVFRWTASGGMTLLSAPHAGDLWLSRDGTRVVGAGPDRAFWIWEEATGFRTVSLPEVHSIGGRMAISDDARVVIGPGVWRWSEAEGSVTVLPSLPENSVNQIYAMSEDGTAVFGAPFVEGSWQYDNLWRWTPSSGYTASPVWPNWISSGGRVVAGCDPRYVDAPVAGWAFDVWRWTEQLGRQPQSEFLLPGIPPFYSPGMFFSADGSTVAVSIRTGDEEVPASIWNLQDGVRSLAPIAYFNDFGISRDGSTVVGIGEGKPWVWNAQTGVQSIYPPGYWAIWTGGWFVSADGSVAGASAWDAASEQAILIRWNSTSGMESFNYGPLPAGMNGSFNTSAMSRDGSTFAGVSGAEPNRLAWRWTRPQGFHSIGFPDQLLTSVTWISADGSIVYGTVWPNKSWRWTASEGTRWLGDDFAPATWIGQPQFVSSDGAVVAGSSATPFHKTQSWIATYAPVIEKLSPTFAVAGEEDVPLVIFGIGFEPGAKVLAGGTELVPDGSGITPTSIAVSIPGSLLTTTADFATLQIRVVGPGGDMSRPASFTVIGGGASLPVGLVESGLATPDQPAEVSILPSDETSGGISATLTVNTADSSASVTVATYWSDPSGSGNTSFSLAGQFLDLNASGVTDADSLEAFFYYPAGTPVAALSLRFWNTHVVPPDWDEVTPISIDTALNRIRVVFNADSRPSITELDGTFFAPAVQPPIQFTGFLAPIGGADQTGGSSAAPLRTFKLGSTIPVKFSGTANGVPVTRGRHTLQVEKFSSATTVGTAIDASPQDAATSGNEFRYQDGQWQFNLDTDATGMARGIWKLTARLSDGASHTAWIQIK